MLSIAIEQKSAWPQPLNDTLQTTLKKLEDDYKQLTKISNDKKRWDTLTEKEKIENEKAKFVIMQAIDCSIKNHYGASKTDAKPQQKNKKSTFWRKALLGFLIVADLTLMCVGGFLGSVQILQLIPSISFASQIIIGAVASAIEAAMMYSIFKPMLQQGLDIPIEQPKDTLANHYGRRLALMEKMNSKMVNNGHYTVKQGPGIYQYYAGVLQTINQDMKRASLLPYKEPAYKRAGRYFLSGLNLLLSIAGTYFGTTMLLTVICAPLVGTPIGLAIIGTLIFAQLLSRLLIRQNSTYYLLNPAAQRHEEVRKKLNHFEDKSEGIDYDLSTMRKIYKTEKNEAIAALYKPNNIKPKKVAECPTFFKPCEPLSNKITTLLKQDTVRHLKRKI